MDNGAAGAVASGAGAPAAAATAAAAVPSATTLAESLQALRMQSEKKTGTELDEGPRFPQWGKLSSEIHVRVLQFLDAYEMLTSIARVSKTMYLYLEDPLSWSTVALGRPPGGSKNSNRKRPFASKEHNYLGEIFNAGLAKA